MAETTTTTVNDTANVSAPASTPPMPFPAERLVGEHLKANFFDFGIGGLMHLSHAALTDSLSFRTKLGDKILADSQDLANKIKIDAATFAKALDTATTVSIASGQTLNQQNLNPVSQGEGEAVDAQVYPPNRSIDSNTALGGGVVLGTVANALAQGVAALAALTPVLVTASGGASTPSQTTPKPAA